MSDPRTGPGAGRAIVLIVASGAAWEPAALRLLGEHPRVVVLRRCVDVDDLLAAASAGQADVAIVGLDAPGLDRSAVERLRGHGVRAVAITRAGATLDGERLRAGRIGISTVVSEDRMAALAEAVTVGEPRPTLPRAAPPVPPVGVADPPSGRVLAVWGAAGAPGRTTVAGAVAAELARRRRRAILIDADPYGGAVAQQLGILDEVSGLLSAARLAMSGQLAARFGSVQRGIDAHLSVVTGLPRGDRWVEVRHGALEELLAVAGGQADVVVDTGFSLEEGPAAEVGGRPARNALTLAALDAADEVLVVGSADPVGLARLARGLVELRERRPGPVQVVVNRMRPGLGWAEREVAGMLAGLAHATAIHFLPDDQAAVDRALVSGRTLLEGGESPLTRAVARLVDTLAPVSA